MKTENYLRYALIMRSSTSSTNYTNIVKLVKTVLTLNSNKPIIIADIIKAIQINFSLEFIANEIILALKHKKYEGFEVIEHTDPVYCKYSLTPEMYQKTKETLSLDNVKGIFKEFLIHHSEIKISLKQFSKMITDYLYSSFSTDVSIVSDLIKNNNPHLEHKSYDDFDDDQKEIINCFLNWRNEAKDRFVYRAISCGIEYCMLSLKKEDGSLESLYKDKVFYFDSNVVFRLMGSNLVERQNAIQAFIDKCKLAGIELKYTNFTIGEIEMTIEHHVKKIEAFYHENPPIRTAVLEELSDKYANLSFFNEYKNWVDEGNRVGDYEGFENHLFLLADGVLSKMKAESHATFSFGATKEIFNQYCDEFEEIKRSRGRYTHEGAIHTDIENYMFILEKAKTYNGINIEYINDYFITTDHIFVDWAKIKLPNVVPQVVLPSVWYSILLKCKGRSNNDYEAFSRFLNLRISEYPDTDDIKTRALRYIVALHEPNKIKEALIFEASRLLRNHKQEYESVEAIVNDASVSVMKTQIDAVKDEKEKEKQQLIEKSKIEKKQMK